MIVALNCCLGLGVRRRFVATIVVFVLFLAAATSSGFFSDDQAPLAVGKQFKPTMNVPAGVDVDGDRVDDQLDSEIAGRVGNGTANEPANVIVMLSSDTGESAAAAFMANGGNVTTELWRNALNRAFPLIQQKTLNVSDRPHQP